MELGVDIEEIQRFKLLRDDSLLQKIFSSKELNYAFAKTIPAQHLCGFFCAKEAFIKALKNRKINLQDIEIFHSENGAPNILIKDLDLKLNIGIKKILVSISHTKEYATATVIIC